MSFFRVLAKRRFPLLHSYAFLNRALHIYSTGVKEMRGSEELVILFCFALSVCLSVFCRYAIKSGVKDVICSWIWIRGSRRVRPEVWVDVGLVRFEDCFDCFEFAHKTWKSDFFLVHELGRCRVPSVGHFRVCGDFRCSITFGKCLGASFSQKFLKILQGNQNFIKSKESV